MFIKFEIVVCKLFIVLKSAKFVIWEKVNIRDVETQCVSTSLQKEPLLTLYHINPALNDPEKKKPFENMVGNGENACN